MDKNYQVYYDYWHYYYFMTNCKNKRFIFNTPPKRDIQDILADDRKVKKILAKARSFDKTNKSFRNP